MPKREGFEQSRFILGEGAEDAQFARALIKGRNLLSAFDVSPNVDLASVGGNSGFETAITACEPITGFTAVTEVVLLADNDDDPNASFTAVCDQITDARSTGNVSRNWGVPSAPVIKAPGDPSVSIWMWPSPGQPGCLETLLWQVILTKYPKEAKCVDSACRCAGTSAWRSVSKLDKARVRCFVALVYKRNPAIALSLLWRDCPKLVPVTDRSFKPFSDFLRAI